jgi:hypothetical protein
MASKAAYKGEAAGRTNYGWTKSHRAAHKATRKAARSTGKQAVAKEVASW